MCLAREGAHVVAVARTAGGLEELDDAIRAVGGSATLVPLDLNDTPASIGWPTRCTSATAGSTS